MKKLLLLVVCLLILASAQAKINTYAPHYPYQYQIKVLNKNLKLAPKLKEDLILKNFYSVKIHYPELQGNNTALIKAFNATITNAITKIIDEFKADLAPPNTLLEMQSQDMPLSPDSNSVTADYDAFFVKPYNILGIRFIVSVYYYRAAHPNTYFFTLNYDLQNNKVLQLADLFKDNNYLYHLQNLARDSLKKKMSANIEMSALKQMLKDGTEAKADNYQNWNLTDKGLLISFPPYQVAPYALGPQFVLIDYKTLQGIGFKLG